MLNLKMVLAATLWTACVATAVAFTLFGSDPLIVWALVTAAAAAVVTAMIAGDYIAADAAGRISAASVDRMMRAIEKSGKSREDKIVGRVGAMNEAALRRVAQEIAAELRPGQPTRLR